MVTLPCTTFVWSARQLALWCREARAAGRVRRTASAVLEAGGADPREALLAQGVALLPVFRGGEEADVQKYVVICSRRAVAADGVQEQTLFDRSGNETLLVGDERQRQGKGAQDQEEPPTPRLIPPHVAIGN